MSAQWTAEQVLNLAVNANARKNAQSLAKAGKWLSLHTDGRAVWGEIKGSGSSPYQARIDLTEPAFKCDCGSKQIPCKHSIALFLLYVDEPTAFGSDKPPQWVTAWLTARDAKEAKKNGAPPKPVDEKAQTKRAAAREEKVTAGLDELDLWLRDIVRGGLASVQGRGYQFWDGAAKRMSDAQVSSIASQIRELPGVIVSGEGWIERALERLGKLYLLAEGYRSLDLLSPETRMDVRSLIGWSQKQEDLLMLPAVRGRWLVTGKAAKREDGLTTHRTWLWHIDEGRAALHLDFQFKNAPKSSFEFNFSVGTSIDADLIYYPGAYPLRVVLKERRSVKNFNGAVPSQTLTEAIAAYSAALARNPWLTLFPMVIRDVIPAYLDGRVVLCDADRHVMPITLQFQDGWKLMALSGGHPVIVAGEWDGDYFLPLSALVDGQPYSFSEDAS